ncbi:MAG: addiction module toxin RelE [Arcobacter sp.]|nr:MAG: addiction module toxin RelE [Arcobacter sp.]
MSTKKINEFNENPLYKDSKSSLESWHKELLNTSYSKPNEIKEKYKNSSIVGNNRVVFNMHRNKYRLIVKINYPAQIIYIRFIGTHKQYDEIDAREI